jgi:cytochrome c556
MLWALTAVAHGDADKLPPGPIHDRHELMEEIGDHAKKIGAAVKKNDAKAVVPEADALVAAAKKINALFPPGSTHEHSRAKPEIWQQWDKFQADTAKLEQAATSLAKTAREGGDIGAGAKQLFGACKSCHDSFRVPEEDED